MQPETVIQRAVQKVLEQHGYWVIKIHGNAFQKSGIPDILAVKNGRATFFEVKTPTGSLSRIQEFRIDEIKKTGGAETHVVTSASEVLAIIE